MNNKKDTFLNTFIEEAKPVPGASELYRNLNYRLQEDGKAPSFHYLSGSPWPLYSTLMKFFVHSEFPIGTLDLNHFQYTDPQTWLQLGNKTAILQYKLGNLRRIFTAVPNKKFLLFGDSTQKDPETYATAFKSFKNIQCIFIRLVEGANEELEKDLNSNQRFATAFKNVPAAKWNVFRDYRDLKDIDIQSGKCRK